MQHNPGVFILVHLMRICVHLIPNDATEAAVVNNCTSPVHSTASCDKITYEQVYSILAKSQNSFNIESALYPPKRPSSVRVLVNVYGPNETDLLTPAAKYTWSISCLYAALPAEFLEIWSLWAIQVNRRTQKLNITISISCCDVTKGVLKKHIEDSLAALEDLAIKPTQRDPRLNSAECVIEGHESDITATGHSDRIVVVIVCSVIFSVLSGSFLAFLAWTNREEQKNILQRTMNSVCVILLGLLAFINIGKLIVIYGNEKVPTGIVVIQPLIVICGLIIFGIACCGCLCGQPIEECIWLCGYIICANLVAYHFCWLVVGIMLNPLWGLFDLLVICLFVAAVSFFVYLFFNSTNESSIINSDDIILKCQSFYWSFTCIVATSCFLTVVVLTGQSYNGKETADEVFKDVVWSLISACFAWIFWNSRTTKSPTTATSSPPDPDGNPSNDFLLVDSSGGR